MTGMPLSKEMDSRPSGARTGLFLALLLAAGITLPAAVLIIFGWTPEDTDLGFVQKIFYFHMPSALYGYLGFTICFVASIGYLVRPGPRWDVIARTGAELGLLFCALVLISGPFWARKSWNRAWTGEPRLVLTLVLFIVFLSYVLVRTYGGLNPLTRQIGAVLAVLGFADIPLVHLAVKKWGGHHPRVVAEGGLASEMWPALAVSLVALGLVFALLFWIRFRQGLLEEAIEDLHRNIADRELTLEG